MTESARRLIDSFEPLSLERRRELEDFANYLEAQNKRRYIQLMCVYDRIIDEYK